MIVVFTVASCCSPSERADACQGPSGETTTQPAVDTYTDSGMDDMQTAKKPARACPLFDLAEDDPQPPPLYPFVGTAHWPVPAGQPYFDQGLQFFFAFNNRESYRAFRAAADEAESAGIGCSACYWGQALPLGVDINMPEQSERDRKAARDALHRAIDADPSPEDWGIIRALFERYQDCTVKDLKECQRVRNQAYYRGMKRVLDEFGSDDPNVITLFADSAMNLTPWDYWDENGNPIAEWSGPLQQARTSLEKALDFGRYSQNEGPIHWYIHLMEGSRTPGKAKPYAGLLASLAPNAGHLVHMPSHIYYRLGEMQDAIWANKKAIEADEAYFAKEDLYRPDDDRYRYDYYLHNIHFLLAAAVLSGDSQDVNPYADKLLKSAPGKGKGSGADRYLTIYYLARMNFSSTADIRNFRGPDSFDQQPLANLAYDYTQLMADIWDGNRSSKWAGTFGNDLAKYRKKASDKGEQNENCNPPATGVQLPRNYKGLCLAAILDELGQARIAASDAKWNEAVDHADRARMIQDALPYKELPVWLYPTRQTLASVLIRRADPARHDLDTAKQLLLESLNKLPGADPDQIPTGTFPGNGWAYYGLWEIANKASPADVNQATTDLEAHWFGTDEFRNLERM
ncbi:hypothetical protein A5787_25535 [Mycobacterium sp. 852002-50816_SCH5313054-b]|nr:hypothetical protein A5787_25535 [Mycobacterium sp. 852002-50816_SCH5313054-b]